MEHLLQGLYGIDAPACVPRYYFIVVNGQNTTYAIHKVV